MSVQEHISREAGENEQALISNGCLVMEEPAGEEISRGSSLGNQTGPFPARRGKQWLAPTPSQLRVLLTEMDGKLFLQHVLLLAFQSLHPMYPEWGEEVTFNAHLANHLRWVGKKGRATMKGKGTAWLIKPSL